MTKLNVLGIYKKESIAVSNPSHTGMMPTADPQNCVKMYQLSFISVDSDYSVLVAQQQIANKMFAR